MGSDWLDVGRVPALSAPVRSLLDEAFDAGAFYGEPEVIGELTAEVINNCRRRLLLLEASQQLANEAVVFVTRRPHRDKAKWVPLDHHVLELAPTLANLFLR